MFMELPAQNHTTCLGTSQPPSKNKHKNNNKQNNNNNKIKKNKKSGSPPYTLAASWIQGPTEGDPTYLGKIGKLN